MARATVLIELCGYSEGAEAGFFLQVWLTRKWIHHNYTFWTIVGEQLAAVESFSAEGRLECSQQGTMRFL